MLVVPQATEVNDPQAVPDNNCILAPELERSAPIELRVIVQLAAVAVKEYQTSSSGVPVIHPAGIPEVADASQTEPELLVVPAVKTVAVPQSSLVGGGVYNIQSE
jgi:hypothetical protein